jgi:hypothetical protein
MAGTPSTTHPTNVRKPTARTATFWTVNNLKSIVFHCKPTGRLPATFNFGYIQRLGLSSVLPSHVIVTRSTNPEEFEIFLNSRPDDFVAIPSTDASKEVR